MSSMRIGATRDLEYKIGETFTELFKMYDNCEKHIDFTDGEIGSLIIYKTLLTSPALTIAFGDGISINEDGDVKVFKDIALSDLVKGKYKYQLPLRPAGGGAKGLIDGQLTVV